MQKTTAFLLQGAGFFFFPEKFIATLYFLCTFPSFHVPFSLGFNDKLKGKSYALDFLISKINEEYSDKGYEAYFIFVDSQKMIFPWIISRDVTKKAGTIEFSIRFY